MFASSRSSVANPEGQNPKFQDAVFCEGSPLPLAVPGALIATIWGQVYEGLRAVPRGGAEVGGLILGRRSETLILAESVVPIPIEYHFGPTFRLSPYDLKGIEALMASLQKDPSKPVVGFYRSRTRNDSLSEESESAVLAALERAHTSFASDFHYFVAFTPLSESTMTASASYRKDEGWDAWQHVSLLMDARPATRPIEFAAPSKAPQAAPPAESQSPAVPVADPQPRSMPPQPQNGESRSLANPEPSTSLQTPEPHPRPYTDWALDEPLADASEENSGPRVSWYVAGAVLLAAVAFGTYLRMSPARPTLTVPISSFTAATAAPAPVHAGFAATWEGSLWKLKWDRAAVEAARATSGVLSIRDGVKEQQVGLTPSDLTRGTFFYQPQSKDLLFSLNLVLPGRQFAEEHVRVLQGLPNVETRADSVSQQTAVPVSPQSPAPQQAQTVRPFAPAPNPPADASAGKAAVPEVPAPPALIAATNQPLNSVLPIAPAAPVQMPVSVVPKAPASQEAASEAARLDLVQLLAGSWAATFSDTPFATESATISVGVYTRDVDGWFLGTYKIPRNGPSLKQPVSFQFRGNLDKDRQPDGAWAFTFKSADGWQGGIKLRPQGKTLDVTWKASLEGGKTYTFEHVMGRPAAR